MKLLFNYLKSNLLYINNFNIIINRYKNIYTYPRLIFIKSNNSNNPNNNNSNNIMNPVYFRHVKNTERFEVAFEYINNNYDVSRQFNMDRNIFETIEEFKNRIKSNLLKIINKKINIKNKKQKESKIEIPEDINVDIIINGESISNDSVAQELFDSSKTSSGNNFLIIDDIKFDIIINGPWIKKLKLPSCILSGCFVYPKYFEHQFTSEKHTIIQWLRQVDKDFIPVGEGFYYKVSHDDVGHTLKLSCTPKNENLLEGPTLEILSDSPVQAGPQPFLFDERHMFTKDKLNGDKVVSYNILAEIYCDTDVARQELFVYCPSYALEGEYRRQLIIQELLGYNADLICLQEVDDKCYHKDLSPILLNFQNLEGNFCVKSGNANEGLAIFYDKNRFRFIESMRYIIGEEIVKNHYFNKEIIDKVKINEQLYTRIIERNTTLQLVVLQPINEDKLVLVANTHLYFHPDSDHIRLIQGALCMKYIQHVITELKQSKPGFEISLIFCGDFNSDPKCGMYHLMTQNKVLPDVEDWKSNPEETIDGIPLSQPYPMSSACGTPEFTNFTVGFVECLDYIYYQNNHMKVTQVVPFPSREELQVFSALPSPVYPSDHLALIADLQWIR